MECPIHGKQGYSEGALFCTYCGRRLVKRCRKCGTENAPGARFCVKCGRSLQPGGPEDPKQRKGRVLQVLLGVAGAVVVLAALGVGRSWRPLWNLSLPQRHRTPIA
jgi:hypothetical protein